MPILEQEFRTIDSLLRRHLDASSFRVTWRDDQIEIFQRYASDVDDMLATFGQATAGPLRSGSAPRLRFTLVGVQPRVFRVDQWHHEAWQRIAEAVEFRALAQHVRALR